jgi:hypothetical protein
LDIEDRVRAIALSVDFLARAVLLQAPAAIHAVQKIAQPVNFAALPLSRAPAEGRAGATGRVWRRSVNRYRPAAGRGRSRMTRRAPKRVLAAWGCSRCPNVRRGRRAAVPAASGSAGSAAHPIAAVPGDEYGDRDGPPLALQNKWKPSYVDTGNRRNFLRELPAGPAVVPPINGGVCADGRRTF